MMRFLMLAVFFFTTSFIYAQEKAFVYDDHGKRDPFAPVVNASGAITVYDSNLSVVDLSLEGIVADAQAKNVAIINGKIVKVGDTIGPYAIESIAIDSVGLTKDQDHFTLKLKRGGI